MPDNSPAPAHRLLTEKDRIAALVKSAHLLPLDPTQIGPGQVDILHSYLANVGPQPLRDLPSAGNDQDLAFQVLRLMGSGHHLPFTCKVLLDVDILPFQNIMLRELWFRAFPMVVAARGSSKSFCLGLYFLLRLLFHQGCKVVVVGSAFRQSKVVFEYAETIWGNAPILRDLAGTGKGRALKDMGATHGSDRWEFTLGESLGVALPMGSDGKKVRGQRANYLITDEFSTINPDVYNVVFSGFASVSDNPVEGVKSKARIRLLKQLGYWTEDQEKEEEAFQTSNQSVVAGTADYGFQHFAQLWRLYRSFINSKGDPKKLEEIFKGPVPRGFNWRDYSIVRIPADLLPEGFMDEKNLARAKLTHNTTLYNLEFGAAFCQDSDGFYRRSLIESCVVGKPGKPVMKDGETIYFEPALEGQRGIRHVISVDPASEVDNFSITVVAQHANHRRLVYCWTTTARSHQEKLKRGLAKDQDFYVYCARKVRDLMRAFPGVAQIALDKQGGGVAVAQALQDERNLQPGEQPVWPLPDPPGTKHRKDSDGKPGLHILELVSFSDADYVSLANHGLKLDLEQKNLLFPAFDGALMGMAEANDYSSGKIVADDGEEVVLYDSQRDLLWEIEQLKNELSAIVVTRTSKSGREHWDLPTNMTENESLRKRAGLKKDRYIALLMANMTARTIFGQEEPAEYQARGGFAHVVGNRERKEEADEPLYRGPSWLTTKYGDMGTYGRAVRRGRD